MFNGAYTDMLQDTQAPQRPLTCRTIVPLSRLEPKWLEGWGGATAMPISSKHIFQGYFWVEPYLSWQWVTWKAGGGFQFSVFMMFLILVMSIGVGFIFGAMVMPSVGCLFAIGWRYFVLYFCAWFSYCPWHNWVLIFHLSCPYVVFDLDE